MCLQSGAEGGGGGAGAPPELWNFFSTNMVHILHMPPTQKTLGCSCTEDANPTALRK